MVGKKPSSEEEDPSRRAVLRKVGGAATGIALAGTLQTAITSSALASDKKSQEISNIVRESDEFRQIKQKIDSDLGVKIKLSRSKVREFGIEGEKKYIATFSGTEEDSGATAEVSSLIRGEKIVETKGLIKLQKDGRLFLSSITSESGVISRKSVELNGGRVKDDKISTQQTQCIPCTGDFCDDVCVTVWDAVCNGISGAGDLCGYEATAACLLVGFIGSSGAGAACALFWAAICEGDVSCSDGTPEDLCQESSNACDDPWLK